MTPGYKAKSYPWVLQDVVHKEKQRNKQKTIIKIVSKIKRQTSRWEKIAYTDKEYNNKQGTQKIYKIQE